MAKLFFRYSAMDAGKTLDLLKVAFNYQDRGQHTIIITSQIDNRAGVNQVKSRIGLTKAAISLTTTDDIFNRVKAEHEKQYISCILIDEIHFFTVEQIKQITDIVDYLKIPVICYGLRSDYCGNPFPSSAYLMAVADTIEELKTICHCGKKATFNMLVKDGVALKHGPSIVVDNDILKTHSTRYISVCRLHWKEGKTSSNNTSNIF